MTSEPIRSAGETGEPLPYSTRYRRAIVLSLGSAALLYLIAIAFTGSSESLEISQRVDVLDWLYLFGLSLLSYLVRFVRWHFYVRRAGWILPLGLHLPVYFAAFALTTTPGKAGETIRSVLLRPHGIPYSTSLACFFSERLLDVVVVALLATLSAFIFGQQHGFVYGVTAVFLMVIPLLHSAWLPKFLQGMHRRAALARLETALGLLLRLLHDARSLLTFSPLCVGLLLGTMAWGLQGFAFYCVMHMIGFPLALLPAVGIYAFGLLAGALSMIPGGIGATEVATGLMLAAAGADPHIAVVGPLISRMSTLWFAVFLGFVASAWLGSRNRLGA